MTSRERWTIYPLLFLALGAALRGRMADTEEVRAMQCENLTIVAPNGKPLARLGATRDAMGRLEFYNSAGRVVLSAGADPRTQSGAIILQSANDKPQVAIQSNGKNGIVETCGPDGAPAVIMGSSKRGGTVNAVRGDRKLLMTFGHDEEDSGVFALDIEHHQRLAVPFAGLVRPVPKPDEQKPAPQAEPPADTEPGSKEGS